MKRSICLILLITALFSGYTNPAEAQFLKKIFGKEKKRKPAPKKPVVKEKPVIKPIKKREIRYPVSQFKPRYRVDVLVPLYLDELVKDDKPTFKGKLPNKALPGMEFYEGVKLAADTLTDLAYDIDVHIHDITDNGKSPEQLVNSGALNGSDLIIGAVQSQQIPALASFAKNKQINFISALSPSDADVKDNPYFTLLQPSLQTHCEWIMRAIERKYRQAKPVLFYRTASQSEENAYNYLLNAGNNNMQKVLCHTVPSKAHLQPLFNKAVPNIIIMAILENTYADSLLNYLSASFPDYKFEVYGMPSWNMTSLRKAGVYPNLTIYTSAPFHYDITTPSGQALANAYKRNYGSNKPGEMVYRGYETMYWYAYLLNKYGTIFNEKLGDNVIAPFTRFEVRTKWDKNDNVLYNENQHIYFYRYEDGSYRVER